MELWIAENIIPAVAVLKSSGMNFLPNIFRRGFSLIELLVTIAIISLLTGLTIAGYGTFNKKQTVKTEAYKLASNLRLAQQKAISGEKPVGCTGDLQSWQMNITANSYSQIVVCINPDSSTTINTTAFPTNVSSSAGTITFSAMTGSVAAGSGYYTLIDTTPYTNTIEITPSGGINVQ